MHNVIILQKLTKNEFNVAETVLNYYVHEQGENLTFWGPKFCEDCDTPKYTYIYILFEREQKYEGTEFAYDVGDGATDKRFNYKIKAVNFNLKILYQLAISLSSYSYCNSN